MSNRAVALVWERARAGGSNLLMLVKIADLSDDEGRNCFAETPHLGRACRMAERTTQNTLQRLLGDAEIEIEYNDTGREIQLRGGRLFRPKWFIHVRCVCEWTVYREEPQQSAASADFARQLRRGRPSRKSAASADSGDGENRRIRRRKPRDPAAKTADSGAGEIEGSVVDLLVDLKAGAPAPPTPESAGAARRDSDHAPAQTGDRFVGCSPAENLRVITKIAHEVLALFCGVPDVTYAEVEEAIERRCRLDTIAWAPEIGCKAIESALFQRRQAGKPSVLPGAVGEAAFRMKRGAG